MDDESRYHTLLRNSSRRRIIEILGEQEKIGFKELKESLGLGVGTVYYHLDMLSNYLMQDKQRKYKLTDKGRFLHKSLKNGNLSSSTLQLGETFSHRLTRWLFMAPLFSKTSQPLKWLPVSLLVLVFGAFGSALASSQSLLFFYSPFTNYQFETTVLLYVFNWISLFFFSDLVLYTVFKRVGGDLQLFVCIGLASLRARTYTVGSGELKMDLIVKNWTWNTDLIQPLLDELAENDIKVPIGKSGLALWMNLASIPIEKIDLAEQDTAGQDGLIETQSMTRNMYVEGAQVGVTQNNTQTGHEELMKTQARLRERFKLRFTSQSTDSAGFVKYVPKALIRDGDNVTVVDVKASYIAAGNHMRLFLSYPYFGNNTLEHDPSLGLETLPTLVTSESLAIVVGVASTITIAVLAYKWKRKIINIVGPN